MSKVYAVYHCWEVDYYNTTKWEEQLICVFDTLEKAKAFQAKYEIKYDPDKVVWYKKGVISIVEMPTTYDEKDFWWLEKPKAVAPVEYTTREELAKIPKSNIPMFFKFNEKELKFEFNKE